MAPLRILISGASVAGPMAAYWLSKTNAHITVVERFPSLRTAGQNIDIRSTGVTIMRRIPGMEATVRAKLVDMEGMAFVNPDGTPFATMHATGNPDQQSLMSEYEIFRGDLSKIITDLSLVSSGEAGKVNYVFSEQISSISHPKGDEGPVRVAFANGKAEEEYDLIVACDGSTSRTRALAFDCDVRTHVHPIGSWAAYFSVSKDLLQGSKLGKGRSVPGGKVLFLGPDPEGKNRVCVMCWYPTDAPPEALEPFRRAQKSGTAELKEFVAEQVRGTGWVAEEVVEGLMETEEFYASEIVQVKLPTLSRKRCVFVGDAGYATGPTGTGTSLAMTGAYVLAGEINAHKGDLSAGLAAYEGRMRPIINDMQVVPPGVGSFMAPQTERGIWVRNTIFWVVCGLQPYFGWLGWLGSLWTVAFASGDKFKLPEYDFKA